MLQRGIAHGDDFGVAAAIDFAEVVTSTAGVVIGVRWVHAESTVLGSTRMAFQMPSRLARVEMTTTMTARLTRSGVSISTSRGKWGNAYCPIHHASAVAKRAHEQRLLENEAADDAIARADELEQRDVADFVERQRVDDQRDDDGGNDDEQHAEEAEAGGAPCPPCRTSSRSFCSWVE